MINENEKNLLIALEELNKEYLDLKKSKEYSIGKNIIEVTNFIKRFKILELIKFLKYKKSSRKEKGRYQIKKFETQQKDDYSNIENKKIVVYTCITGNYDDILEPLYMNDNVEYVLLTNNKNIKSNKWKIIQIPEEIQSQYDNIMLNRFIKINPHNFFKEYDYSIYIDGNIRLISDISCYINKVDKDIGIALHMHSKRNCIYDEEMACERLNKGNVEKMREQIKKYREEGYPENNGLLEANMIVVNLKSGKSKKILQEWWAEFLSTESLRDQLSLPYIIWKNDININDVGVLGNTIRNNPKIQIMSHN